MTGQVPGPENPSQLGGNSLAPQGVSLGSRIPSLVRMGSYLWPRHDWPDRLDEEDIRLQASETLPGLVTFLSEPIAPAPRDEIAALFGDNPHGRSGWELTADDLDSYRYTALPYEGEGGRSYLGIHMSFDANGRLIKQELFGPGLFSDEEVAHREEYVYDEEGYLVSVAFSQDGNPYDLHEETFEYTTSADGAKAPKTMTKRFMVGSGREKAMVVDLENPEEWIASKVAAHSESADPQ